MARRFTIKERIDLVRNYYSSGNDASGPTRKVGENLHHAATVVRLIRKFEESGSVADEARLGGPSVSKFKDFELFYKKLIQIRQPQLAVLRVRSPLPQITMCLTLLYSTH